MSHMHLAALLAAWHRCWYSSQLRHVQDTHPQHTQLFGTDHNTTAHHSMAVVQSHNKLLKQPSRLILGQPVVRAPLPQESVQLQAGQGGKIAAGKAHVHHVHHVHV